jgi:hypothetical protein
MATELLKKGVVLPITNFTAEDFSYLEGALEAAPGFVDDSDARFAILSRQKDINMHLTARQEVRALEQLARQRSPDKPYSLVALEGFLQEKFPVTSLLAEVPAAPARIRGSKAGLERGVGALVVAESPQLKDTRIRLQYALAEFYDLKPFPRRVFNPRFIPGVQLGFVRNPRELGYLRHLEEAISERNQSIVPPRLRLGQIGLY